MLGLIFNTIERHYNSLFALKPIPGKQTQTNLRLKAKMNNGTLNEYRK
jgi:hypothetical protein